MSELFIAIDNLPNHYRYEFNANLFAGTWRHDFRLIGARGGCNLHIARHHYNNADHWSAGLEYHFRAPPEHMRNQPPSHDDCWLLRCPCWHDGTSLYAQDKYVPMFISGHFARIFHDLVFDCDGQFGAPA